MNYDEDFYIVQKYNLVTRREIAQRCGVHERNVHRWIDRRGTNGFPPAIRTIGEKVGRPVEIYWWPHVWEWSETYKPRRGANGARNFASMGDGEQISKCT